MIKLIVKVRQNDFLLGRRYILDSNYVSAHIRPTEKLIYGPLKFASTTAFWRNHPYGRLVDAAVAGVPRVFRVHYLFHMGGISSPGEWDMRLLL